MFLKELKDSEKVKFLELVYKIAYLDGKYTNQEMELVGRVRTEMGAEAVASTSSVEELLKSLGEASLQNQKIVVLELYAILLADDGELTAPEKDFLKQVTYYFSVPQEDMEALYQAALTIYKGTRKARKLILQE